MPDIVIEQAIFGSQAPVGYRFLASSPGFLEQWLPWAQRLCAGFGERPAGVACPECVLAQPFGRGHVAVVQVADLGADDTGRPGALGFRLLVMPRAAYRDLVGDPFAVAERLPPSWEARGQIPALSWPAEPLPPRTVGQVQAVLQRPDGPTLLGGVQALVDGGRLVFERPAPDRGLIGGLWTLLPTSTRHDLWPASFAFGNALRFHALVVPRAAGDAYAGYVSEQQTENYPQGRYELNLQIAAEAGDQRELDSLLARRSRAQMWRLGLTLLAVVVILAMLAGLLAPPAPERRNVPPPSSKTPADKPAPVEKPR
ncbi:MAG TPA: hypothetical protein VG013_08680 [Gemmataceae bacterium]|jgi:hypothetical protein|nr:hypothetical protein [Gemmataceae bacterium]